MTKNETFVSVRSATPKDAKTIAEVVAMAIGDDETLRNYCGEDFLSVLEEIAQTENTQYSYHNSLIAEVDGRVAGAVVGYNGAMLLPLRNGTFAIIEKHLGTSPNMEPETSAGEFYLDSLAVFPPFRGNGVARSLILALSEKAFAYGHQNVGLLVDFENPNAEILYRSVGFVRKEEKIFLGHKMWHMQKKL